MPVTLPYLGKLKVQKYDYRISFMRNIEQRRSKYHNHQVQVQVQVQLQVLDPQVQVPKFSLQVQVKYA